MIQTVQMKIIARIHSEVHDHLLHLPGIAAHERARGLGADGQLHVLTDDSPEHRLDLGEHTVEIDDARMLAFAAKLAGAWMLSAGRAMAFSVSLCVTGSSVPQARLSGFRRWSMLHCNLGAEPFVTLRCCAATSTNGE